MELSNVTSAINVSILNNFTETVADINGAETESKWAFLMYLPGFILNVVAIVIIFRDFKIINIPTNATLSLLCIFDCLAILHAAIWHVSHQRAFCRPLMILNGFFPLFTGLLSAMMAMDRAIAMWLPYTYKEKITSKLWFLCSAVFGVYTLFLSSLPTLNTEPFSLSLHGHEVCISFGQAIMLNIAFPFLYSAHGFLVVFCIIVCNVLVIRVAVMLSKRTDIHPAGGCVCPGKSYEMQFARLVGILTIFYVVCWTPFYVEKLMDAFGKELGSYRGVIHSIAGLNYVIDPIVYVWIRKSIRVRLWETIKTSRCLKRCRKSTNFHHPPAI